MTIADPVAMPAAEATGVGRPNSFGEFWYRFTRSKAGVVALVFIVAMVILAIIAPLIQTSDPFSGSSLALAPPLTDGHFLVTDNLGRDVYSQLVNGSRVSLLIGFSVAIAGTVIGIIVGATAGYFGGWVDSVLMRISEFFQTLPRFVLALIIIALFGSGLSKVIFVLAILSWPQTARVVRTGFQTLRSAGFVDAARVSGMPRRSIIVREILPNVLASVIVVGSLDVAGAILIAAALSFFGLGDPNLVSWGGMLQQAQLYLTQAWWMAVFPGVAIALVVLAFNLVGDGLNDALNPRLRDGR
jgi:peptide/nickel transport system permease protein